MALELYEGLENAGNILHDLSAAVKTDSDGGSKITMSELLGIITKNGIKIIEDVQDDEPEATEPTEAP